MAQPRLKVLVAYSMSSTYNATTFEYLSALKRYTDFDVSYVHVTHDAEMDFDLDEFDVIFQNYCARLCFEGFVSRSYQQALRRFTGLKVLAVQDDYDRTWTLHRAIRELGFHVLLTCIQREFWPLVYPASELPDLHIVQGLTGYVPETLIGRGRRSLPLSKRQTVIGYRGNDIGARYGRLGFEKYEIGRRMIEICTARGIPHDIAMDESSRIYGDAWYEFLASCRVALGSESGSNVFDFDGSIERSYNELRERLGRAPTYTEFQPYVEHVEQQFNVGQISPRVFECAVMRTPMVLFRGRYSDVIDPDAHYIALEKDFSNIDAVLRCIEDIPRLEAMTERAYEHLVSSGRYNYEAFATKMKAEIEWQYQLLLARNPRDRKSVERDAHSLGAEVAEPSGNILVAEKPTAQPQSFNDFQRKQVRVALQYFVEKLPELQLFYTNAVVACIDEAKRLAADYIVAAEQHAGVIAPEERAALELLPTSALNEMILCKADVEEELASAVSQVDTLRQQRKSARQTEDEDEVEATFERELEVLKRYFERGPQLYQNFHEIYQQARDKLIEGARAFRSDQAGACVERKR